MADLKPPQRLPLLFLGMVALVAGTLAGLGRLGVAVPTAAAAQAGHHGALMVAAFFGTVISLERAVALARGWAYLGPAAAGLGGLTLLLGAPWPAGPALLTAASAILVAGSGVVLGRLLAPFTAVLGLGATAWLVGNLAWLAGGDLTAAVPWWLAFLVLTIAGERLELTRFLPTPQAAKTVFLAVVGVVLGGAMLSLFATEAGLRLFAGALVALALWLLRYDIARRNAGQGGLTGYIARCLLSGYGWLLAAGLLGLAGAFAPGHPWRDAALHAIGLGFVFAMVFGHAPIIFPAVARVKIPYHPVFYLPLVLLHLSLFARCLGVFAHRLDLRQGAATANGLVLLLFIAILLTSVVRGRRSANP